MEPLKDQAGTVVKGQVQMVTELIAALDGLPSLDWDLVPRTSLIQEFIDRK